jgi:hypothetical protein
MNKSIFIKNAGNYCTIWQREFKGFVGNRFLPVIEQLKLDKRLFLKKFSENTAGTAGTGIADKRVWRTGCDGGSASGLRSHVSHIFAQSKNVRRTCCNRIGPMNRAGIGVSHTRHGERVDINRARTGGDTPAVTSRISKSRNWLSCHDFLL